MPTASGRRSGVVCGEKSPKTRLARIYCYGNTLYTVNFIVWQGCLRGSMYKANASDAIVPGFEPRRGLLIFFFLIYLKGLCHGLSAYH